MMVETKRHLQKAAQIDIIARMVSSYFLSGGYIFRTMGIAPALFLILLTWVVKEILNRYTIDAFYYTSTEQTSELIELLFSKKVASVLEMISEFASIGSLTSSQIIISSQIAIVLEKFMQNPEIQLRYIIIPFQSILLIFPLSLLKDAQQIHALTPLTVICIAILSATIVALFIKSLFDNQQFCSYYMESNPRFQLRNDYELISEKPFQTESIEFLKYFPSFIFMFSGAALSSNYRRMQCPAEIKRELVKKAVSISLSIVVMLYALVSCSIAFSFGKLTTPNIFTTIKECNLGYFDLLALVFAFVLLFSNSLSLQSSRSTLMQFMGLDATENHGVFVMLGVCFIIISSLFALKYENIVSICGLFTAPSGFIYYFLVPIMCAYKLPFLKQHANLPSLAEQLHIDPYPDDFIVAMVSLVSINHLTDFARKMHLEKSSKSRKGGRTQPIVFINCNDLVAEQYYADFVQAKYRQYSFLGEYQVKHMQLRKVICSMLGLAAFISCSIAFVFNLKDFIQNK